MRLEFGNLEHIGLASKGMLCADCNHSKSDHDDPWGNCDSIDDNRIEMHECECGDVHSYKPECECSQFKPKTL